MTDTVEQEFRNSGLHGFQVSALCYKDLRDFTVIARRPEENWKNLESVQEVLSKNGVCIQERRGFDSDVVWDASIKRRLIVMPMCLQDVIFDMRVAPMDWEYSVSSGLFYRSEAAGLPKIFLDFVRNHRKKRPEITKRLTEINIKDKTAANPSVSAMKRYACRYRKKGV